MLKFNGQYTDNHFFFICKQFISNFLVNVLFDYFFTNLEIPDDKTGIMVYVSLPVWICLFVKVIILLHQIHENPDRGTDTLKNDNLAILYKDEKKVNTVVCMDSVL